MYLSALQPTLAESSWGGVHKAARLSKHRSARRPDIWRATPGEAPTQINAETLPPRLETFKFCLDLGGRASLDNAGMLA